MNIIRWVAIGIPALTLILHAQTPAQDYAKANQAIAENNAKIASVNKLLVDARAAKARNDFDLDSSLMQQATAIKPNEPLLWLELGDAQVGQKKFQEAIPSYKKVIELTEATKTQSNLNTQARYDLEQLNTQSSGASPAPTPTLPSAASAPCSTSSGSAPTPRACLYPDNGADNRFHL
ncbi:hypothetical protein FTO74_10670 [Granulicella sp. WH15]|uniref:hypothetical protein n=1 Tax=Granulicella sp. WH15 TaxID=2602070 RepID=UPI001366E9F2|nr:hypothetical protein [Granulicella sp. WH15]QHN03784.1 hypothetical protein FTO74_10670 [Granulicella sp. WH15]